MSLVSRVWCRVVMSTLWLTCRRLWLVLWVERLVTSCLVLVCMAVGLILSLVS